VARIAEVDEMVKKESAEILNRSDLVCFGSGMILFIIRIPLSGSFRIRILSQNTVGVSKYLTLLSETVARLLKQ
jgi:hypothetical protein